jgi:hypothetical protein
VAVADDRNEHRRSGGKGETMDGIEMIAAEIDRLQRLVGEEDA